MKIQSMMRQLFSRNWLVLFLISILASVVFARLGVWQLDRLEQRRIFNSRVMEQKNEPVYHLEAGEVNLDLFNMEFRKVKVTGAYDFDHEIVIRNQSYGNQNGVHLVTPLRIDGRDQAILVDRGWVPYNDFMSGNLAQYSEEGRVAVEGVIRRTKVKADFGGREEPTPAPGEVFRKAWFFINVDGISKQVPYPLVEGVYIQQTMDPSWTDLPARSAYDVEISEGPHFGYALQWFAFSIIAFMSVPVLILYNNKKLSYVKNKNTRERIHDPAILQ
jgi:surfeit locus 1 family protein